MEKLLLIYINGKIANKTCIPELWDGAATLSYNKAYNIEGQKEMILFANKFIYFVRHIENDNNKIFIEKLMKSSNNN